ncbi:MAG: hypothetical protein IPJ40_02475 [Saprospirales bacterium]|nr:hypothetical protein [Saprospirales bacterium]
MAPTEETCAINAKGDNGMLHNFALDNNASNWVAGQPGFGNSLDLDGIKM